MEGDADLPLDRPSTARDVAWIVAGAIVVYGVEFAVFRMGIERSVLLSFAGESLAPALVVLGSLVLAARARREGDRDATLGALLIAAAAVLAKLAAIAERWLWETSGGGASDVGLFESVTGKRHLIGYGALDGRPIIAVLGLAMPAIVGARALRLPWHGLLRPPRPAMVPVLVAIGAGLLLFPALAAAHAHGHTLALRSAHVGPQTVPEFPALLHQGWLETLFGHGVVAVALTLSLLMPCLELLLHGMARRAFAGAAALQFVVTTAVVAALVLPTPTPTLVVYGGFLVTGTLARRTESVVPGIAFWQALALGEVLWRAVVP